MDYVAKSVRKYTDNNGKEQATWTTHGPAFVNKDGSFTILLNSIPVAQDGGVVRILVFKNDKKKGS